MRNDVYGRCSNVARRTVLFAACILVAGVQLAPAQTYISAEPIPSEDIVGTENLAKIRGIGYPRLELWSQRLLNECQVVQNVINALTVNKAISTIIPGNTRYIVAAGGFEGVTNPTFVLTMQTSGLGAVSAADVYVLNNALGYVLNQSGTAQFSIPFDKKNPFEFSLDYAVVTHPPPLTGERARDFFDYVGTIDPELWNTAFAGFTQISFGSSAVNNYMMNNSMLFLIGAVPKQQFIEGLSQAASTTAYASYSPIADNGKPTTAKAGAAFPGNDWIASPGGQGYLVNLGNASAQLLNDLAALRQGHLQATTKLLGAIDKGTVELYLKNQFKCR
jgi:hypothetical protein